MMSIKAYWRKDLSRYEVTVCRGGDRRRKLAPVGMKKREALQEIGEALLEEMQEKEREMEESAPLLTLWGFCEKVYRERHGVSDRTWEQRRYKVSGIMEDLGHHLLLEVTTPVVTEWLKRLEREGAPRTKGGRGKPLKAGGAAHNDYLVTLKAIFRVALDLGYIDKVPFRHRLVPIDLTTDREPWNSVMKTRLLAKSAELDPGMRRLAEFLMLTGCRPVEALRLLWSHVQQVPAPVITFIGKGYKHRKLPLRGALAEFFRAFPRKGFAVFSVSKGPRVGKGLRTWPQLRWERVCAEAKVPSVAYDLRHTFITEMVVKGLPLPKIAKWCGNSVRVIEERYSHLMPEHLKDVADLVGGSLECDLQDQDGELIEMKEKRPKK